MTGREHFEKAEKILTGLANSWEVLTEHDHDINIQRAQVHASLALAAATAKNGPSPEHWGVHE